MELWIEHPKYKGLFVSNTGKFKREDKKPVKVIPEKENGYLRLSYNGVRERCHVLVAEAWLNKPESSERLVVHHKDGDKMNNRADNLEWRTNRENIAEAGREGKLATTAGVPTPIMLVEIGTGRVLVARSQIWAARALGVHNASINKVLRGNRKSVKGYKCYYIAEIERALA